LGYSDVTVIDETAVEVLLVVVEEVEVEVVVDVEVVLEVPVVEVEVDEEAAVEVVVEVEAEDVAELVAELEMVVVPLLVGLVLVSIVVEVVLPIVVPILALVVLTALVVSAVDVGVVALSVLEVRLVEGCAKNRVPLRIATDAMPITRITMTTTTPMETPRDLLDRKTIMFILTPDTVNANRNFLLGDSQVGFYDEFTAEMPCFACFLRVLTLKSSM